jgi:hypothetical protein
MGRFDPNDRRSDDMVAAIERAAHSINHTLREGFVLLALQIADTSHGVDNSPAIEAATRRIRNMIAALNQSLPPTPLT